MRRDLQFPPLGGALALGGLAGPEPAAVAGHPVTRQVAGLLLAENFDAPSGWTSSGVFAADATLPAMVCSERSPTIALSPGATTDAGGVRESTLFFDGNGDWLHCYGAGDGTAGAGGPWRPQMAVSSNYGRTFTRLGSLGIDLRKDETPAHGNWAARDQLDFKKFGSTFYWYVMSALNASGSPAVVPDLPYRSDVFTATLPKTSGWTWIRQTLDIGAGGSIDENADYSGSLVYDPNSATYYLFSSLTSGSTYHVSYATASDPAGPFTKLGASILPVGNEGVPENPKVFYSERLGCWVMLINQINLGLGATDKNSAFFSSSLSNWSAARRVDVQRVCPADGANIIGLSSPVGIPGGGVLVDSLTGIIPVTYDTDPSPASAPYHAGRKIRYAQHEPARSCLRFHGDGTSGGTIYTYRKPITHSDGAIECSVELFSTAAGLSVGVDFRVQGNGDCYRLIQTSTGLMQFQTVIGGVATNIGSQSGALGAITAFAHRWRIEMVGTALSAYLDGELQASATDATWASGTQVGLFASQGANAAFRLLSVRTADVVTITNLVPGQLVGLRGFGDLPLVSAFATTTSLALTHTHFPAHSLTVNDTLLPVGSIWGGDTLKVATNLAPQFDATLYGAPVLWVRFYKPSELTVSGSSISAVTELSGSGVVVNQVTSGSRPQVSAAAQNGLDVATFSLAGTRFFDLAPKPAINATAGFTIVAVVKIGAGAGAHAIVGGNGSGNRVEFGMTDTGQLYLNANNVAAIGASSSNAPTDRYVVVAVTYDKVHCKFWINGVAAGSTSVTTDIPNGPDFLGKSADGPDFLGGILEVACFGSPLTDANTVAASLALKSYAGVS